VHAHWDEGAEEGQLCQLSIYQHNHQNQDLQVNQNDLRVQS
jgi:hypothetical protein